RPQQRAEPARVCRIARRDAAASMGACILLGRRLPMRGQRWSSFFMWFVLLLEGLGMQLARELFNRSHDARRGPVNRITDHRVLLVSDGIQNSPAGQGGERVKISYGALRMGFGKDQKIRLHANDFF